MLFLMLITHYVDQCMDGEALLAAFGERPGPDCIKDILPKFGQRIKVYRKLKEELDKEMTHDVRFVLYP